MIQKYCSPCTDHGLHGQEISKYTAIQIDRYIAAGSLFLGEDYKRIIGSGRYRDLTDRRHMIIGFLKSYTNYTLADIGRGFGNRDHATVIHAVRQVENMCESSQVYKAKYKSLVEHLKKM